MADGMRVCDNKEGGSCGGKFHFGHGRNGEVSTLKLPFSMRGKLRMSSGSPDSATAPARRGRLNVAL